MDQLERKRREDHETSGSTSYESRKRDVQAEVEMIKVLKLFIITFMCSPVPMNDDTSTEVVIEWQLA